MTKKETTVVALKCFAVFILYQTFALLPSLGTMAIKINHMGPDNPSNVLLYVIPVMTILSMIIIAALLWRIANSVLIQEPSSDNSSDLDVTGVTKIIFSCMGVYFIIDAMICLPDAIATYQLTRNQNVLAGTYLLTQVLELIFGALLVAKPGKWVKAIRSIERNE